MQNLKLIVLSLVAAGALQGCSSAEIRNSKEISAAARRDTEAQHEKIQAVPAERINPTRVTDAYIPVLLLAEQKKIHLPEMFQNSMSIHREFDSLNEVAERITYHSGLPVSITPDALKPSDGGGGSGSASAAPATTSIMPATSILPVPAKESSSTASTAEKKSVRFEYTGNISGFLDLAASRYGVSWRYANGQIEFYRMLTKTFVVKALAGSRSISSDVSNSDGPRFASTANVSIWGDLEKTINTMISSSGKVYVNQATGTVTVTDLPSYLLQIEDYIDQQNAIMSKQVLLSVRVLSVSAKNSDQRGVNLNAVFNSLSQNFGWTFSSAFMTDPNAASLTMRILDTAGAATGANISSYQGTNAIVTALRAEGEVTTMVSWSGVTLNNQPAPITVGRDSGYLQSTSTTTTANVGATTTLTPGTYVTGISMNMLPHILDGGDLLLESSISISSLANLFSQTANGNTVQFPEINKRKLQNSISMRSGQTLILTGFDQNTIDVGEEDTGYGQVAGGAKRASRNKDMLVILITAVTADKL